MAITILKHILKPNMKAKLTNSCFPFYVFTLSFSAQLMADITETLRHAQFMYNSLMVSQVKKEILEWVEVVLITDVTWYLNQADKACNKLKHFLDELYPKIMSS